MSGRPSVGHLWHVALRVRDLAAMENFYVNLLGFKVEWRPDEDNVYLTTGRDNLALHVEPHGGAPGVLGHIGICVARREDVDAWAAFLAEAGVPMVAQARTHRDGARSFYAQDPEENVVQFIFHPPIAPFIGE